MTVRNAVAVLAFWALPASGQVDVLPRPLDSIAPGTVIGEGAPKGWTDLVMIATPRLGVGDVEQVSKSSASYSGMFRFTSLCKVRAEEAGGRAGYVLDKLAVGLAADVEGRNVIVTGEDTRGADLGILGRHILGENERILKEDVRRVARTPTMVVFDMKAFVLREGKHRAMTLRHAVLASPATGRISTFVWLLGPDGSGGYSLAEKGLQKLPPAFREDRVLSVDGQKFTFGIPSNDAFALAKTPQGTPLGFSEALKGVAASRAFTPESARKLEAELSARYAPVADRPRASAGVRR